MTFRIPFGGRSHWYTDTETSTALAAMRDGMPLTQGSYLKEFEEKFCHYSGNPYAFAVSNATAALEIAALLCQFKPADEVIIPAHTYTSSAYPFAKAGAEIVWADIDPETRVVNANTIAPCIGEKSRAIVVPHLYGFGAYMPEIMVLAKKFGLIVIEDAAQAIGVRIEDQLAGTFGDLGIYSFHSHKNMTTLGEGGMLVLKNPEWAEIVPAIRHNGHRAYPDDRPDYWLPAMTDVALPEINGNKIFPMNCCLGEVECAVGTKLLERIGQINHDKRARALKIIDALADCSLLDFHRESSERHNYHLLAAQVQNGLRDQFIRQMAMRHSIQCVTQYQPLNRYSFYQDLGFGRADVPRTNQFFDNMVSLPFSHCLNDREIDQIVSACKEVASAVTT
jgi:perosamine synthetase